MNLNSIFLKSFRFILLPVALVYGFVVIIRNLLYDKGILRSATFNFPIIVVGNLAVGGTGKSPMVEYLIDLLRPNYKIATLSRGYKRKTKGYTLANESTTALEIGDEPMQFHIKYEDIPVAVGEERVVAIPQLLYDRPFLNAIILDDAFQHREVKAGFNIVLTDFSNLFIHDFFIPTGDLRDEWSSSKRADVIIVTKCPAEMSLSTKQKIEKGIRLLPKQHLFFTTISYGKPYHIIEKTERPITNTDEVFLFCGIANPKPIKEYLIQNAQTYYEKTYNDHHIFTIDDIEELKKTFNAIAATKKLMLTTEKDAVRLIKFSNEILTLPIYVLPIRHSFLFEEREVFNGLVIDFIQYFKQDRNDR